MAKKKKSPSKSCGWVKLGMKVFLVNPLYGCDRGKVKRINGQYINVKLKGFDGPWVELYPGEIKPRGKKAIAHEQWYEERFERVLEAIKNSKKTSVK